MKNADQIYTVLFWNNAINFKLSKRSGPAKIYHIIATEKLPGIDNLDELIINTSFQVSLFLCCLFHRIFYTLSNNFLSTFFLKYYSLFHPDIWSHINAWTHNLTAIFVHSKIINILINTLHKLYNLHLNN